MGHKVQTLTLNKHHQTFHDLSFSSPVFLPTELTVYIFNNAVTRFGSV